MTPEQVQHPYTPRKHFEAFHRRHQRFSVLVCHRRAGKTVAVVNDMVVRALRTKKPRWFGAYVAPTYGQAKQIAWAYIKEAIRGIPGTKVSETETSITFPNGSKIRVFGADNADALRGLYFDMVVLDEVGDIPRRVWSEVIRPALADRQGSCVFLGTPKGKNFFYELAEKAKHSGGDWYYLKATADNTGVIPESELVETRKDMDADEYAQEFMCSFDAALKGSYYGTHMTALEARGAMRELDLLPDEPVSVAMDIGFDDASSIWFWQVVNGEVRFIDYWEESGYDAEEVVEMLELKPYRIETVWLPHDANHRTFRSKKSVIDVFRDAGLPARKVPNPDQGNRVIHGVNAVRQTLRTYPLAFDQKRCARGIEALKNYSRKWDPDAKVFGEKAKHDQWSHGADAFRYACLSFNHEDIQRSKERASRRRQEEQLASALGTNQLNSRYRLTLQEAIAEREQRLATQRAAGRSRI